MPSRNSVEEQCAKLAPWRFAFCPLGPDVGTMPLPTRWFGPPAAALPVPWRLATAMAAYEIWVPILDDGTDDDDGLLVLTTDWFWWTW